MVPPVLQKILVFDQKYQVLGLSTDTIVLVQYRLIVLLTKSTGLSTKGTTKNTVKYCGQSTAEIRVVNSEL